MNPSWVFMMRLSGSVKSLALWDRVPGGRGGGPSWFRATFGFRFSLASARAFASAAAAAFASASNPACAAGLLGALLLVGHLIRHLVAALSARTPRLLARPSFGCAHPRATSASSSAALLAMRS